MASMDPKILAAVFASIAAIAVGTGGGSVDQIQNFTGGDILSGISMPSDNILQKLREKPEPTNRVRVSADLKDGAVLEVKEADLRVEGMSSLKSEKRRLTSDSPIVFRDFSGQVEIGDNSTSVKGESRGFVSGGVNLTQSFKLQFSTSSEEILLTGLERNSIELEEVNVDLKARDGTEISQEDASVRANSFSGNISVRRESLVLRGMVDRIEAGSTVYK